MLHIIALFTSTLVPSIVDILMNMIKFNAYFLIYFQSFNTYFFNLHLNPINLLFF